MSIIANPPDVVAHYFDPGDVERLLAAHYADPRLAYRPVGDAHRLIGAAEQAAWPQRAILRTRR